MKQLLITIFGIEVLYAVRKSRLINFFPRLWLAMRFHTVRLGQILRWLFTSREDTNFTYNLTADNKLYLANMVSVITGASVEAVQELFREVETDDVLRQHILTKTRASQYRIVADNRVEFGRRLGWYALVRLQKPSVVIETGVDKGLGAVLLCSALLRNRAEGKSGRYFGTDIAPKAGYLLTDRYAEVGQILYGDSIESLKKFTEPIDLFINDSDHSATYEYDEYETIIPKLAPDGIILGDNAHVTSKLAEFSGRHNRRFLYFQEVPQGHWYPGAGIGFSFP
jgi:predicted O-methyltransferase YrrM